MVLDVLSKRSLKEVIAEGDDSKLNVLVLDYNLNINQLRSEIARRYNHA